MEIEGKEYKLIVIGDEDLGLIKSSSTKSRIEDELKSGVKDIALDMANLNSVNSAGLGVLIGILNKVRNSSGTLKLVNVNDRIQNIFTITKLNLIFDISK
ncbi:MAG: STAS domain-containing protein [Ignavibacteria bacterium]|nr:STAS domain-containing protein [Ignavibacteria bacterium]